MLISASAVEPELIADCLAAVERENPLSTPVSLDAVDRRLHFNGSDPSVDAMAYIVDGRVDGFANVWRHGDHEIRVFARTRPRSRQRGVGLNLMEWALTRARAVCEACAITATSRGEDILARSLLLRMAFSPVRQITTLTIEARDVEPHVPELREVRIQSYDSRHHADLLHAHAIAFSEEWGYETPVSAEAWWAERSDVDPSQSLIGQIGTDLVGFCLLGGSRIAEIGVVPAYRRRGIGGALLRAGLNALVASGASEISLQVDSLNPSGALPMYARAGMRARSSMTIWQRDPA